jgi:hypothetical protein
MEILAGTIEGMLVSGPVFDKLSADACLSVIVFFTPVVASVSLATGLRFMLYSIDIN